jgi:nucleotide-binding universal stress UspA family protein
LYGFKRIVAATDLSDCSSFAVARAKEIATRFDAQLTLLHVVDDDRIETTQKALDEHDLGHFPQMPATKRLIVSGSAPETILATSRRLDADLVVVSSRGRGRTSRALLGSVAESVVSLADRPVLTIPCRPPELFHELLAAPPAPASGSIRRVLCTNGSGASFACAIDVASRFDARLVIRAERDGDALMSDLHEQSIDLLVMSDERARRSAIHRLIAGTRCGLLVVPESAPVEPGFASRRATIPV